MISLEKILLLLSTKMEKWIDDVILSLPNLLIALLILLLFLYLARVVRTITLKLMMKVTPALGVQNLICSTTYLMTIFLGLFLSLGVLNLDKTVSSLLAGAGIIGLALGFAFQEIASNFVSGVFIAFQKPYNVGDIIEVDNILGTVTSIDIRTTTVTTFQGIEVLIPNKMLFTGVVSNYTSTPERRIDLKLGVSYADDLEKVENLLKTELEKLPNIIMGKPLNVQFTDFGDSSINLVIQMWVHYPGRNNFAETQSEAIKTIKKLFEQNNISIPYPIRSLDFGAKGTKALPEGLVK